MKNISKLVRALPQHPKVLSGFTWFVSILFSNVVADYRSFMFETIGNRNKNFETSFLFFIACLYNKMFY